MCNPLVFVAWPWIGPFGHLSGSPAFDYASPRSVQAGRRHRSSMLSGMRTGMPESADLSIRSRLSNEAPNWTMMKFSARAEHLTLIVDILHCVPRNRLAQLMLLLPLMLLGSLFEVMTIGAVLPFVQSLVNPETLAQWPMLQRLLPGLESPQGYSPILTMSLVFTGVLVIAVAMRLLVFYMSTKFVFAVGHDLAVYLYKKILHQPYSYHIHRSSSELLGDIGKVRVLVSGVLGPCMHGLAASVLVLALLVASAAVDAATGLSVALIFVMAYFFVVRSFQHKLESNSRVIASAQNERVRALQEGVGGIRDVILDGNQKFHTAKFADVDGRFVQALVANSFYSSAPRFFVEAIVATLIVAVACALALQSGGLSSALPTLAALALAAYRMLPLVQNIYQAWARLQGNLQVVRDVHRSVTLPDNLRQPVSHGDIAFEHTIELLNVAFRYGAHQLEVLSGISLTIPKGARVGIIGRSGSGKSTLADIIMGLLAPTSGELRVDGVPIGSHNCESWRGHIAHVPQDVFLADASIAENIALGVNVAELDHERVQAAARRAQLSDLIQSPTWNDCTGVGERGVRLSGGQRQRVGIARALYKSASVLVFDEASSALDTETEAALMSSLKEIERDVTVFIIAHRTSTLRDCDFVIRLADGRVTEVSSREGVVCENEAV